jgi:carboxyl-terminal processing protease
VQVKVSTSRPDDVARAGDSFELQVELKNVGRAPLYRLKAVTKSDSRLFSDRELVFGRLNPGQSHKWSATLGLCRTEEEKRSCLLPRSMPDRADGIRVEFDEAYGHAPADAEVRTTVKALPQPEFAYLLHLADNIRGNGDGRLQRGESATLYLIVKNVGKGKSYETLATLRNLSGRGILLRDGRFQLGELPPGAERTVAFTFEVLPDSEADEARLEVAITDTELLKRAGEKLSFAVGKPPKNPPQPASGRVDVRAGAVVREQPSADARVVAEVRKATAKLASEAKQGSFTRVDLGEGRPGWVADGDLVGEGSKGDGKVIDHLDHSPPSLEIDHGGTLVTRKSSMRIRGRARDNSRVHDLYLFVDANKVFYQSNRGAPDPSRAVFDTRVLLHPGINYITIVARENDDIASRRTFVVRRDAADGSLMETPKIDEGLIFNLEE